MSTKKRATSKSLNELLDYYYEARAEFLKNTGSEYFVRIPLTLEFLRACEERIIESSKRYKDDWKTKDCKNERTLELYDLVNYTILDMCQKKYISKLKRQKSPRRRNHKKSK